MILGEIIGRFADALFYIHLLLFLVVNLKPSA